MSEGAAAELYRLADLLRWTVIPIDGQRECTITRDVDNSPTITGSPTECLHFLYGIEWERRIGYRYQTEIIRGVDDE